MDDFVLSRTQRNDIFELIKGHGLNPADFQWGSKPPRGPEDFKETVTHNPTKAYVEFSRGNEGTFWFAWWPHRGGGRQFHIARVWHEGLRFASQWLDAVVEDQNAPDMWAEIAKVATIADAGDRETAYQQQFSASELKQLEGALPEIEKYITTTQQLNEEQKKAVHQKFVYLLDAAKRGVRKVDWLNIFVGQVVGMVTAGLLDPRVYGAVMTHAATVLNAIFQFGVKLLT